MTSEKEDYLIQIRDKLRKEGIKLWLTPYLIESNGVSEVEIMKLSTSISESLNIPLSLCTEIIKELQINSLENLKQKSQFNDSGLATLKIKIVTQGKSPKKLTKEIMLNCRGADFKALICQELSLNTEKLKVISAGRVISDKDSLCNQGVKNGQQILGIILTESPEEFEKIENKTMEVETIKTDSKLLANDCSYMRLEDQFGNTIKIPEAERSALIVALTLHEKGRAALKREDFSTALVYFLESDQEFKNCSSALLNSVDNYALLDLDIAWCYLCLQSFTHLPEAEERLKRCKIKFSKIYGSNLERLIAVKGTPGNEACLLARLHLLQAVVLYHQNKRSESLLLFKHVECELQSLRVDEESVSSLVELGYSLAEARLGLRATGGDVTLAVNYIDENREKRYESRRKALAEEVLEKEKRKLGKCVDGKQYIEPNFVNILVNMGYNKEMARNALRVCNNVISDSIQYIQDNPTPGPSQSKSTEFNILIEELVPQLVEAGFDPRMAKIALQKFHGDLIQATEELLANDGIVPGDLSQFDDIKQTSIEDIRRKKQKLDEEKKEAFKRLKDDLSSMVEDDYLDINLVKEEMFLKMYLSMLEKK
ncbi:hypothetical protein ABEB36_005141 [Hypothenemus hampei]|uniref:NEDD8 ultimate buster 1 n=1 Tax=Hypothenemus hampei TaxID=57062 RepID=A0ABD1EX52_HYPHA